MRGIFPAIRRQYRNERASSAVNANSTVNGMYTRSKLIWRIRVVFQIQGYFDICLSGANCDRTVSRVKSVIASHLLRNGWDMPLESSPELSGLEN